MAQTEWHKRWDEGRIGFHLSDINPHLSAHWSKVAGGPVASVLVPLCGKTEDLHFLREKAPHVVGVELVTAAVEAFFDEWGVTPTKTECGPFVRWQAENITLLQGDVLKLAEAGLPAFDAIYDRAALIALPRDIQPRYARVLQEALAPKGKLLAITIDHPDGVRKGPPYAIRKEEMAKFFSDLSLECLQEEDIYAANPKFHERGMTALYEMVWLGAR